MIVDSSAWIDFLRRTESAASLTLRRSIADEQVSLLTTDVIRLEVLSGADQPGVRRLIRSALAGCQDIAQLPRADVEAAVDLFQFCRRLGETITLNDCLIAAIAIRVGSPVLHRDRDFDVLAQHTLLQTVDAS